MPSGWGAVVTFKNIRVAFTNHSNHKALRPSHGPAPPGPWGAAPSAGTSERGQKQPKSRGTHVIRIHTQGASLQAHLTLSKCCQGGARRSEGQGLPATQGWWLPAETSGVAPAQGRAPRAPGVTHPSQEPSALCFRRQYSRPCSRVSLQHRTTARYAPWQHSHLPTSTHSAGSEESTCSTFKTCENKLTVQRVQRGHRSRQGNYRGQRRPGHANSGRGPTSEAAMDRVEIAGNNVRDIGCRKPRTMKFHKEKKLENRRF